MWSVLCRTDVATFEGDVMSWLDSLSTKDQEDVDTEKLEGAIDAIVKNEKSINQKLNTSNFQALRKFLKNAKASQLREKIMKKIDVFREL